MICPVEIASDLSAFLAARVGDHAKHGVLLEGRDRSARRTEPGCEYGKRFESCADYCVRVRARALIRVREYGYGRDSHALGIRGPHAVCFRRVTADVILARFIKSTLSEPLH
jgi:hypothetical protein